MNVKDTEPELCFKPDTDMDHILYEIGTIFTHRLMNKLGGMEVSIPRAKNLKPYHLLVQTLGMEDALLLCEVSGKRKITIGKGKFPRQYEKAQKILALCQEGKTLSRAALEVGLTERWARSLCKRYFPDFKFTKVTKHIEYIQLRNCETAKIIA